MVRYYLHDEADVHGEGLHSVEAGDEGDGEEALRIHLSPQEEVPLQVVEAEVVLTGGGGQTHQTIRNTINSIQIISQIKTRGLIYDC